MRGTTPDCGRNAGRSSTTIAFQPSTAAARTSGIASWPVPHRSSRRGGSSTSTNARTSPGSVRISEALVATASLAASLHAAPDPLAAEIARWSAYLKSNDSKDELWTQIKPGAETLVAGAMSALEDGRRGLALLRLAATRANLSSASYMSERSAAERRDNAAFEAEWERGDIEL